VGDSCQPDLYGRHLNWPYIKIGAVFVGTVAGALLLCLCEAVGVAVGTSRWVTLVS
jgi:hypothetical protein